jgi:hypothetical protein
MSKFVPAREVCARGTRPSGVYDCEIAAASSDGTRIVEEQPLRIAGNEFCFEKTRKWDLAKLIMRKLCGNSVYVIVTGDEDEFDGELIGDTQPEIFDRIECPSRHHIANPLDGVFAQIPQSVIRCGQLQIPHDLAEFGMAHQFCHSNTFLYSFTQSCCV